MVGLGFILGLAMSIRTEFTLRSGLNLKSGYVEG